MNLYDLTKRASNEVTIYRSPNIDYWRSEFNSVLMALGHDKIHDEEKVCSIGIYEDCVEVVTSYYINNTDDNNIFMIPLHILQSEDPISAANLYRLTESVKSLNKSIFNARQQLKRDEISLSRVRLELYDLGVKVYSTNNAEYENLINNFIKGN